MKKLLLLFVLFPLLVLGQSQDQNYVKTTTYKKPTSLGAVDVSLPANATIQVTYYDGLGRPIQQVAHQQSGTGKDIVTPIAYDDFGRQVKDYLPYVPTTAASQDYIENALTDVLYYADYLGQSPFSQKQFEASPLNRVLKQAAPGTTWSMGSGHEIKLDYQTNSVDEVLLYIATSTWNTTEKVYSTTLSQTTHYAANQLYKTVTKNENWKNGDNDDNTTQEFKDKEGHVVLKRTFNENEAHDTYYVYDQYNNLSYVLPPLVSDAQADLEGLCYQYKYDYRNRLVEKKLPGKQWEYIVYDQLDRPIITGPANSPFGTSEVGWLFSRYDVFGRVCYTGWFTDVFATRADLQATYGTTVTNAVKKNSNTIDGVVVKYYSTDLPDGMKLLTVNYYDDYDFPNAPVVAGIPAVFGQNICTNAKGLATGSWARVLTTETATSGNTTYTLYDNQKYRPIANQTTNYLGGYTRATTQYNFEGQVLQTQTRHKRTAADYEIVVIETYEYTEQGRLLNHFHKINNYATELLAHNDYNELGQLITKNVGGNDITNYVGLQQVDYQYNIRGWLTNINDIDQLNIGNKPDLFAFRINYDSITNTLDNTVKPLYNGNIAETYWRTASDNTLRKYSYSYDALNRLNNAVYQKPEAAVSITHSYDERLQYDKNGNILHLDRTGEIDSQYITTPIDDLTYHYDIHKQNQLLQVVDASNSPAGFKDDGANQGDDYSYDDNGNLTADKNKNIQTINYNHLNLPTEIVFGTNQKISYIYDALGQKQKKVVTTSYDTTTDYLGGYQYKNEVLQFVPTAEGYVTVVKADVNTPYRYLFEYVYNYTDHLGNIRLSYSEEPSTHVLKILEQNHYYPFGLKHNNYNTDIKQYELLLDELKLKPAAGLTYKYKYNGKELQDELGLNMYDYGARNYDPALGRWMNMDAMSEEYFPMSPYSYAINNPIFFIDPDGNYIDIYYGEDSKQKARYGYEKNRDYSKVEGGSNGFLANAYKTLDALYTATNIEVDGKETNLMQTLMDDKRELSVVEGGEQGGSHFAKGRDFESEGKWTENSKNVIGTIHFNTKEGNLYDDVNNTSGKELQSLFASNKLSKNTKIVSATSVFGHEIAHAFNYASKPSDYNKRTRDTSTQNTAPYFKNAEEAKATTLSNLININLGQPQRNNYRAIGVPTQGVLSNQIRK
jgi:RHS repeat-associated protein